jgi:hypothetical protein
MFVTPGSVAQFTSENAVHFELARKLLSCVTETEFVWRSDPPLVGLKDRPAEMRERLCFRAAGVLGRSPGSLEVA